MSENQAIHPVATLCRVLGVSSSGYYAWSKRSLSRRAKDDAVLTERIGAIHAASKGTYGAPRIHAELQANGIPIGKKRVARLMRRAGLAGVSRRRFVTTTVRDGARQAPDDEQGTGGDSFSFAGKTIDFGELELRMLGNTIHLTVMEAELLRYLVKSEGRVVSRKAILEDVWGLHEDTDTRAIDNFVVRLRRYIEEDPSQPKHLQTVRGVGYRFVAEPE